MEVQLGTGPGDAVGKVGGSGDAEQVGGTFGVLPGLVDSVDTQGVRRMEGSLDNDRLLTANSVEHIGRGVDGSDDSVELVVGSVHVGMGAAGRVVQNVVLIVCFLDAVVALGKVWEMADSVGVLEVV